MLDVAEALAQDERRDAECRERHADIATHPGEEVHTGGDPGELRAERAGVGDDQGGEDERRRRRRP